MENYYIALISFVIGMLFGIIIVTVGRHRRSKDKYIRIERIDRMREKGQLTQEEFEKEKTKILQNS
jgi:hypothetical protein